eukprot:XP_001695297.1 predicted protein [Chlamydomonas reinhardtii]
MLSNGSGRYVVLYGNSNECRLLAVDSVLFGSRPGLVLCQVSWHAHSEEHLVVLTSDNRLRLYHVTHSLAVAEQTLHVVPQAGPLPQRYGLSTAAAAAGHGASPGPGVAGTPASPLGGSAAGGALGSSDVVAFAFGPALGWGLFSILLLGNDGLVYSLGPVAPFGMRCSGALLQRLAADEAAAEEWLAAVFGIEAVENPGARSRWPVLPHVVEDVSPALVGPLNPRLRQELPHLTARAYMTASGTAGSAPSAVRYRCTLRSGAGAGGLAAGLGLAFAAAAGEAAPAAVTPRMVLLDVVELPMDEGAAAPPTQKAVVAVGVAGTPSSSGRFGLADVDSEDEEEDEDGELRSGTLHYYQPAGAAELVSHQAAAAAAASTPGGASAAAAATGGAGLSPLASPEQRKAAVEAHIRAVYSSLIAPPADRKLPKPPPGAPTPLTVAIPEGLRHLTDCIAALRATHIPFLTGASLDLTARADALRAEAAKHAAAVADLTDLAAAAEARQASLEARVARLKSLHENLVERAGVLASLHWSLPRALSHAERDMRDQLSALESRATSLDKQWGALASRARRLCDERRSASGPGGALRAGTGVKMATVPESQLEKVHEAVVAQYRGLTAARAALTALEQHAAAAVADRTAEQLEKGLGLGGSNSAKMAGLGVAA